MKDRNRKIKKSKNYCVKKPDAVLYNMVCFAAKYYYRFTFGHRVHSSICDIKPPFLVVAGHSCWFDYMIIGVSMFPIRMNYVAAYNFFRDRLLSKVFHFMGVIPKFQFTNDLAAVKKMKSVIQRGGVVAIFPNGCLSNDGRPGGFPVFGIAKLVKFLKVPVVALKTDGGYLTRPRWTKRARHGQVETKISQVLSVSEIDTCTENEIYSRINEALFFDDYQWQRERMIPYRGRKYAEGVEYVLYKCPKCGSEFTLRSRKNRLFCTACGNAVLMNQFLLFEPEHEDTVFFDGIDKWFDFQKECMEREIEDPGFALKAETELKCAEPGKFGYQHLGFGTVSLTREAVTYSGTVDGKDKMLVFPMKNIPMVPYAAAEYIEIARGSDISRFIFTDLRQQIKWVMAIRQIRDKYYEGAQGKGTQGDGSPVFS